MLICMLFFRVSNDPELYHNVAGVLVESNGVHSNLLGQWQYLPIICVYSLYVLLSFLHKNVLFMTM